jgi:probable rRNA maturation factor
MPKKSAEPNPAFEVVFASLAWRKALPRASEIVRKAALAGFQGAAEARVPAPTGPVSIVLADDATIRPLNYQFRGTDKATNVLSFNHLAEIDGDPFGDVILALETVRKEAREQGKPLAHHLSHLVIHGILHLLGYDHEQQAQARRMEGLERVILARLAIPDPYARKA